MIKGKYFGTKTQINCKNKQPIFSILFRSNGSAINLYNINDSTSVNSDDLSDIKQNPMHYILKNDSIFFDKYRRYKLTTINDSMVILSMTSKDNYSISVYTLSSHQHRHIR